MASSFLLLPQCEGLERFSLGHGAVLLREGGEVTETAALARGLREDLGVGQYGGRALVRGGDDRGGVGDGRGGRRRRRMGGLLSGLRRHHGEVKP